MISLPKQNELHGWPNSSNASLAATPDFQPRSISAGTQLDWSLPCTYCILSNKAVIPGNFTERRYKHPLELLVFSCMIVNTCGMCTVCTNYIEIACCTLTYPPHKQFIFIFIDNILFWRRFCAKHMRYIKL